jgi:hypothetical protein
MVGAGRSPARSSSLLTLDPNTERIRERDGGQAHRHQNRERAARHAPGADIKASPAAHQRARRSGRTPIPAAAMSEQEPDRLWELREEARYRSEHLALYKARLYAGRALNRSKLRSCNAPPTAQPHASTLPPRGAGPLDDARSGFTRVADRAVASAPLRTRPLDHAPGLRYRGPRRLPGPDSHRLAALNLSLVMSCRTPSLHGTEQSRRTRP